MHLVMSDEPLPTASGELPSESNRPTSHLDLDLDVLNQSIEGYIFERIIGFGGMGVVYLAYQRRLERRVAIKLFPELSEDPTGLGERFRGEGRAMAKLQHPNIVSIYETGEAAPVKWPEPSRFLDRPNVFPRCMS